MPPDPATAVLDPARLAEFRRQGGAIVAQERGLTAACRIKLARLAGSLGIPDEQVDAAIRALHEVEPAAPPNPQAEKFRKRLRKDLAGKTRTIIGPAIEAQILAAAAQKYGLDEATARQVLGEVAAELGLTRITASDAIDGLAAQIDLTVGDSTWLAREAWDRLRTAGGKWGIELEVVDELIDEKLAANRQEAARGRFVTRSILLAAGGGAALVALTIVVLLAIRANSSTPAPLPDGGTAVTTEPGESAPEPRLRTAPEWWDVDLAVDMGTAESRFGGLSGASDLMKSDAADERASGYERMIGLVRSGPLKAGMLEAIGRIASGSLALEPDEAAAAKLQTALLALLPTTDAPLPTKPEQYDIGYWASDTAVAALHRAGAKPDRTRALADALGAALAGSFDPSANRRANEQSARARTTLLAYQQLAAAAAKQPAAVAVLQRHLADRAARLLAEEELTKAQTGLLAAALPAAGKDWKAYEETIVRCTSSPDPLNVLRMVDTLQRCNEPELVEMLSQLLVLRASVRPDSWAKADVVKAVRKALGAASPAATSTAADRWIALRERAEPILAQPAPPAADHYESLRQTVELAHLASLAMALAQGEAGFALFDAGMTEPPELQRPAGSDAGRSSRPTTPAPLRPGIRTLSPRERRELERWSTMLGGYARLQPSQRVTALRGLALLADAAHDLSPEHAEPVAKYLLAEKTDEEHAAVVEIVIPIRRWNRLRLAVADLAPQSKLTAPQQQQLAVALLGRDLPAESATGENLPALLVDSALDDLSAAATGAGTAGPDDPNLIFDSAAELLAESYRQRARLFSVGAAEYQAVESPAQVLELSLKPLAESLLGSSDDSAFLANLPHLHKAAKFVAGDDLRQTVVLQRLVIELSARRVIRQRPQQAAAARQLETESLAALTASDHVLAQLRDQEATLLKLWMLYAPEI